MPQSSNCAPTAWTRVRDARPCHSGRTASGPKKPTLPSGSRNSSRPARRRVPRRNSRHAQRQTGHRHSRDRPRNSPGRAHPETCRKRRCTIRRAAGRSPWVKGRMMALILSSQHFSTDRTHRSLPDAPTILKARASAVISHSSRVTRVARLRPDLFEPGGLIAPREGLLSGRVSDAGPFTPGRALAPGRHPKPFPIPAIPMTMIGRLRRPQAVTRCG